MGGRALSEELRQPRAAEAEASTVEAARIVFLPWHRLCQLVSDSNKWLQHHFGVVALESKAPSAQQFLFAAHYPSLTTPPLFLFEDEIMLTCLELLSIPWILLAHDA